MKKKDKNEFIENWWTDFLNQLSETFGGTFELQEEEFENDWKYTVSRSVEEPDKFADGDILVYHLEKREGRNLLERQTLSRMRLMGMFMVQGVGYGLELKSKIQFSHMSFNHPSKRE